MSKIRFTYHEVVRLANHFGLKRDGTKWRGTAIWISRFRDDAQILRSELMKSRFSKKPCGTLLFQTLFKSRISCRPRSKAFRFSSRAAGSVKSSAMVRR